MTVSCEIIKDLLPLYHDKVCSAESRALVEAHLRECAACGELLAAISDEMERPANGLDETKPIKAIRAVWKKDKKKSFIKAAAITLTVCAALACAYYWLTHENIVPVASALIEISDVARLSDGRIVYCVTARDNKELNYFNATVEQDGSYYYCPKRPVISRARNDLYVPAYIKDLGLSVPVTFYMDVDIEELNAKEQAAGSGIVITSYYIGRPGDCILIWEEGMALPPADRRVEEIFIYQYDEIQIFDYK